MTRSFGSVVPAAFDHVDRASRDASGAFGTPVKLVLASMVSSTVFNPTLSPGNTGVWMTVGGSSSLYRGAP